MNAYKTALHWRSLGVATIPIRVGGKRPLISWSSYTRRLPSEEELRWWFQDKPHNLALVCGWQGLVVVDFDDMETYLMWRSWALTSDTPAYDVASLSYQVLTSRGVHVYFATRQPAQNRKLALIDIQADAKYVLSPPSTHPGGHRYTAIDSDAPIIRVERIEDVLPIELLAAPEPEHPPSQARVTVATSETQLASDPWSAAVWPVMLDGGSVIDDLLKRLDIRDVFPNARHHRGLSRQYLWAFCPLHNDRNTPNVAVDVRKQRAKCWAGCTDGRWWDAIDWYAALNQLTTSQAIQELTTA